MKTVLPRGKLENLKFCYCTFNAYIDKYFLQLNIFLACIVYVLFISRYVYGVMCKESLGLDANFHITYKY